MKQFCVRASKYSHDQFTRGADWIQTIESFPINSRAWTLQERFLPPAVLHFLTDSTCWECRTGVGDGVPYGFGDPAILPDLKLLVLLLPTAGEKEPLYPWHHLVERYQKRQITNLTGRLPAICGLAQHFAQKRQDTWRACGRMNFPEALSGFK
jgi:hypothetical protein